MEIEAMSTRRKIKVDKSFIGATEEEISTFDAGEMVDYTKCSYFYRLRHIWNYEAQKSRNMRFSLNQNS